MSICAVQLRSNMLCFLRTLKTQAPDVAGFKTSHKTKIRL